MASSSAKTVWWTAATLVAMTLIGCSTAPRYEGASPSFRSVSGYPDVKNSYVGMNFNFVVDQPGYHHPADAEPAATATASAAE